MSKLRLLYRGHVCFQKGSLVVYCVQQTMEPCTLNWLIKWWMVPCVIMTNSGSVFTENVE